MQILSMIEESKYCSDMIKNILTKKDNKMMNTEDNKNFKSSTKCWICDNDYVDNDVRDHCHITGIYRRFAHVDCIINRKLNHNIPVGFHNLKNYDSHFIMQELDKFSLKINAIPNGL